MIAMILTTTVLAISGAPQQPACHSQACETRVRRKHWRHVVRPYREWIFRTARCESGGRWHIATGNGFYGGLQVLPSTWRSVGGRGLPHQASILEQMYRGILILRAQGRGAWPNCG